MNYSRLKEASVVLHSGSNYVYRFVLKVLAKGFEGEFSCLAEISEKYKTILVPITKEVKMVDKNGDEITKSIPCKLQFIDSSRSMGSSLSNPVDNLDEGIIKVNANLDMITKKAKSLELNTKITH